MWKCCFNLRLHLHCDLLLLHVEAGVVALGASMLRQADTTTTNQMRYVGALCSTFA
jgi:hypothetical protein